MPKIIFHPDVALEVKASYTWYERQAAGLGEDYLSELESAYQAIAELPNTWPMFQQNFRRFLLSKFPFSIIYRSNGKSIFVVAVMHNHRKPGYWQNRS
jgi:plasmid stabilization system protein ParE